MNTDKERTIFEKIYDKEIPAVFLYEDEKCFVIMDKFPAVTGQSLVIPKEPIDYAFNLDNETYKHILSVAKKVALASDKALNTVRTCLVIEGFEVPHAHIKLYPVTEPQLNITPGETIGDEELKEVAEKIKNELVLD